MAKKVAIPCIHPVILILKLKPNDTFNLAIYNYILDYAMFFAQNPATLLDFFFSFFIKLHNVIHIVWAENKEPFNYDLRHFI